MENENLVTIKASSKKLEEFFDSCWEAGMKKTQVYEFLKRRYMPLPWQRRFHGAAREADKSDGPVHIGAGGARGPGKSHAVFAQCTLDDCRRIKGLKGLFLRQTGKAAAESFEDLVDKVLRGRENFKYNSSRGVLEFPDSGSRMLLGGFENVGDIDKYIGIEYDVIAVEELNQLTQEKMDKLEGSLRTSKPNWRPRMYTSFNPGGKGHTMVKTHYVEPYRNKTEDKTRFIPSTYKDNPFLNKEYIDYLEGLAGDLGRAWREGDFDLFEGQFFSMWRHDKHVRPTRTIPQGFRRFLGIDHGRANPFAAYWIAKDWDGNYWVYREYYSHRPDLNEQGKEADDNAKRVVFMTPTDEHIEMAVADKSIFHKIGYGETIGDILRRNGIGKPGTRIPFLEPSVAGRRIREARAQLLSQKLDWSVDKDGMLKKSPSIFIMESCPNLIRTIPMLQFDKNNPEDVDTDGEDHAYDAVTYILQKLEDVRAKMPPQTRIEKKLSLMKEEADREKDPVGSARFSKGI